MKCNRIQSEKRYMLNGAAAVEKMVVYQKLNIKLPHNPAIPLLVYTPKN